MPKMKTHKATAKRFKKTKTGKVMKLTCGQAHFNARESGNTRRNKRSKQVFSKTMAAKIQVALPNQ
jgi:large subunit ribosomal protein L35